MPRINREWVHERFVYADELKKTPKGDVLEEIIIVTFGAIPGLTLESHEVKDSSGAEEIDVGFRNAPARRGLYSFGHEILVECKNWTGRSDRVRSAGSCTRCKALTRRPRSWWLRTA